MEKRCNKCGSVKPLTEFYKCRGMADGYFNQCKACKKIYADAYQEKNKEVLLAKARVRMKNPERIKYAIAFSQAWREEDERRQKCHNKVRTEIKAGRLKPEPCIKCGNEKTEAHHEDYDKPLDVWWLCRICHKKRHKELKMENQNG